MVTFCVFVKGKSLKWFYSVNDRKLQEDDTPHLPKKKQKQKRRVFLNNSSVCPGTCFVQAGFELTEVLLPLPSKFWDLPTCRAENNILEVGPQT